MTQDAKPTPVPTATSDLLDRVKAGDRRAADSLFRRLLPRLTRWTTRRLPRHAREHLDTADIVQDALVRSLEPLHRFTPRHTGALDAYLRQIATNRIRDEIRKSARRPAREALEDRPGGESPLDAAITADERDRYQRCLGRLAARDQEAITARLTDGLTYEELAERLGTPTPGAARVAVHRALLRLARVMDADAAR